MTSHWASLRREDVDVEDQDDAPCPVASAPASSIARAIAFSRRRGWSSPRCSVIQANGRASRQDHSRSSAVLPYPAGATRTARGGAHARRAGRQAQAGESCRAAVSGVGRLQPGGPMEPAGAGFLWRVTHRAPWPSSSRSVPFGPGARARAPASRYKGVPCTPSPRGAGTPRTRRGCSIKARGSRVSSDSRPAGGHHLPNRRVGLACLGGPPALVASCRRALRRRSRRRPCRGHVSTRGRGRSVPAASWV